MSVRNFVPVLNRLEQMAREETRDWDFSQWYQNGVDFYLSRELAWLVMSAYDPESESEQDRSLADLVKDPVDFEAYGTEALAVMFRDMPREMDDFSRLWGSDERKASVIMEAGEWLRTRYEDVVEWKDGKPCVG